MTLTNQDIAKRLREHASELARTGDNLYRVRAFRSAAMAVLALPGAAAVELGHNFSLVHDDIEDGDVERRHRVPGLAAQLRLRRRRRRDAARQRWARP